MTIKKEQVVPNRGAWISHVGAVKDQREIPKGVEAR